MAPQRGPNDRKGVSGEPPKPFLTCTLWSGRRDLNPRLLDPQARMSGLSRSEDVWRGAAHQVKCPMWSPSVGRGLPALAPVAGSPQDNYTEVLWAVGSRCDGWMRSARAR